MNSTVYCSTDTLKFILFGGSKKWNEVISNFSHVCFDLNDEDFLMEIENCPELNDLNMRTKYTCNPMGGNFNNIIKDPALHELGNSNCIFISDIASDKAIELRNQFGVLVISETDIDKSVNIFEYFKMPIMYREHYKNVINKETKTGWKSLLHHAAFKWQPCNSLIIIDNYLLSDELDDKDYIVDKGQLENIVSFIDGILPFALEVSFQILLVINNNHAKYNDRNIKKVIKEIKIHLNKLRPFSIELDYITHNKNPKLHKRCVITNYNWFEIDWGIDQFRGSLSKKLNDIRLYGSFYTLDTSNGTCEIEEMNIRKSEIQSILSKIRSGESAKVEFDSNFKNRLIN